MPDWQDVLSEGQRLKAIASFQQHWSDEIYAACYEVQEDILHYITMRYNSNRLHSYLGYFIAYL